MAGKSSTFSRPLVCRLTSWSMLPEMQALGSIKRASKGEGREQARARASWKGGSQKSASPVFRDLPKTAFEGYRQVSSATCEVLAIVKDGVGVPAAVAGDAVEVVLDHTSFYGDSGVRLGYGWFTSPDGNATVAEITGCVLPVQGVRAHKALLKQALAVVIA